MGQFVNIARQILLGTAWTGTAPGPGVAVPAGTITAGGSLNISGFVTDGGDPSASAAMVDITHHAALGYTTVIPGLTTADPYTFTINSDLVASMINAWVRTQGGVARPGAALLFLDIMPTNAARSATNPSSVAAGYLSKWTPYSGSVGSAAKGTLIFTPSGTFLDLIV